ncbi:DUF4126 domain-containing protein [uncultured Microbacterium sp.]|uniref:DUF4126 domain-containing protein n=1 Tax=uncultured Microbacterium sp. TaxID=191216 RepID=A0A1Y5PDJ0_9MICO|nr:DUF4126 domain-containing protein [uncultured Microbacterium sp.]SBS73978.1 conserved membrane hypothetical protein [uncultured Microbacterium sp.]
MLEFLVGSGLAAAAGLNAWMPLFLLGIVDRFVAGVDLPAGWSWLSSDVALWITGVLLVVEIVADKIPAVDSVNDVLQTAIRPAAGGIVFGAGSSAETLRVEDPSTLFADNGWIPIVVGVAIALAVHLVKATVRPVANAATLGLAAPALSTAEDVSSLALAASAIFAPVIAGVLLIGLVVGAVLLLRRRRQRGRASVPGA